MVEPFLVSNDLDRHRFARTMVPTVQYLSERSLSQRVNDLISISQVIVVNDLIIASVVVIPMVICIVAESGHDLFAMGANEVHVLEFKDFLALLVLGQILDLTTPENGCTRCELRNLTIM